MGWYVPTRGVGAMGPISAKRHRTQHRSLLYYLSLFVICVQLQKKGSELCGIRMTQ